MHKKRFIHILRNCNERLIFLILFISFFTIKEIRTVHAESHQVEILGYAFGNLPHTAQEPLKEAIQNRPPKVLEEGSYFIVGNFEMAGIWGIGHLGAAIGSESPDWGKSIWFIVKAEDTSAIALQGTQLFDEFLPNIPKQFKDQIESQNNQLSVLSETFLFPWDNSQTWRYTYSWHGSTNLALDFAPSNVAANNMWILASKSGTINMVCGGVGYDTNQIAVNLSTDSGTTTYRHIDYYSYTGQNINNQTIPQGKKIALLYSGNQGGGYYNTSVAYPWPSCTQGSSPNCVYMQYNTYCGAGTAPHVHWSLPTKPFTVEGWTVGADGVWTHAGQANRGVGSYFTSSNPPIIIDENHPGILSIVRANPNPTSDLTLEFTVTFSEAMQNVDINDFTLSSTGVGGIFVISVTPISNSVYSVAVNSGLGNGTIRLNVPNTATIQDLSNNNLSGLPFNNGEAYTISKSQVPATFDDVPMNHPYWEDIEILYANGYTAGCSTTPPLLFCPDVTMNRAQSAVFMVRGNFGTSYSPPAAPWTTFGDDFSPGTWAQPWAQGMFDAGLTAGCSTNPRLFCPWEEMPRFQAAVFGMRLREGINYPPPTGTGSVFADIDGSEWYAGWVEQAYLNGLLPACGSSSGTPLFCPNDLVPRGLAAYMIVRAKNLTMP